MIKNKEVMEAYLQSIIRQLRTVHFAGAVVSICVLIGMAVLIFYKPTPGVEAVIEKNKALETLRQAEMNLTTAKLDSIRLDQKIQEERYIAREQKLAKRLNENTNALKRNKDEKPRDYSNYNSMQLQSAVSDLVRQYKNSQHGHKSTVENRR